MISGEFIQNEQKTVRFKNEQLKSQRLLAIRGRIPNAWVFNSCRDVRERLRQRRFNCLRSSRENDFADGNAARIGKRPKPRQRCAKLNNKGRANGFHLVGVRLVPTRSENSTAVMRHSPPPIVYSHSNVASDGTSYGCQGNGGVVVFCKR